jgi:hypothetical protein
MKCTFSQLALNHTTANQMNKRLDNTNSSLTGEAFMVPLINVLQVELCEASCKSVHFLLTENIKRGNQGIIMKCYCLFQNVTSYGLMFISN